jgi:integrase
MAVNNALLEAKQHVSVKVDWEQPVLQRWLGTITRSSTRRQYKSAFRCYRAYTKKTATQLVDEAIEDERLDPREKRGVVISQILGFYDYLKTAYVKKRGGGVGVSDKVAHMRVNAVRSFYGTFDVFVRLKGRSALPKPRVENKRMIVDPSQVKQLLDHTRNPRDRAIILFLFQGGLDVSTLCSIAYGDVKDGLEAGEHPLKLEPQRQKTGVENYTFIGRDGVEALQAYLADARHRGFRFTRDTPLFLQERRQDGVQVGVDTHNVQAIFREVAVTSGLVDADMNGNAFNPLGPHALRESFGSIMINAGVPDTVVDFWLFHEVGEMARAYKSIQSDSVRQMYLDREHLLSVTTPGVDEEKLAETISAKVDERAEALKKVVEKYAAENLELKSRLARVELAVTELKKQLQEMM